MKFIVLLCTCVTLYAHCTLTPILEEDPHFIGYKQMMLESSVYRLEDIRNEFDREIQLLKLQLNLPTTPRH